MSDKEKTCNHSQPLSCLHCGWSGEVKEADFPQEIGFWDHPCPACGYMVVQVAQVQMREVKKP